MLRFLVVSSSLVLCGALVSQAADYPVRDPHTSGYVTATELPNGENAPADMDGNYILGSAHTPDPATSVQPGVPQGAIYTFTMNSTDSKFYPGIARDAGTYGKPDPSDPAKMVVTTSHPAPYTRKVTVYVPKQYVAGTEAPFIVGADGPDTMLFTTLDNLIAQKRVPAMVAISISNGGGDSQGSERGLEYDTMSGKYAEWVEQEVLPRVEAEAHVKLTRDPDGRATMGGSSGGAVAMIMAWYHPELYHRVLSYSGTFINQQWPYNPETPHGAWEFHEKLVPNSPVKPIRIWMEVGDRDLYNPNTMRDGMHDWVLANERMAAALEAKGYHYQFVFAKNAGHVDHAVKAQTLAEALEYVWQGYQGPHAPESDVDRLKAQLADWADLDRYRTENAELPPPAAGEQRVVFYGDSITDGWGRWRGIFFPGKANYINRGVSGQTTPQMLVRFQQDVVHLKPAAVVILAGTNDIAGNTGPSTPEMTEDNFASMAAIAHANGIKVVISSITPAAAYPWRPSVQNVPEKIRSLNAWLKDFCAKDGDVYLDYWSVLANAEGGMKPGLSVDGVHPTAEGYAVMTPLAEAAIAEALGH